MNKVAAYLNEHLMGEVITQESALRQVETDGGILVCRPEMIVRPVNVNDIRKVMRFCSQLAEKGHVLPVYARGDGTDGTGGAVNRGVMIDLRKYMHSVAGIDSKQQLVHVQTGVSIKAINAMLATHKGMCVPSVSYTNECGTVGGAIAASPSGVAAGTHGLFADSVKQLEIVLSNGDVIQTGRLSRRELSKKKGLSTFEGELYREIDNLIADNAELLAAMDMDAPETVGYGLHKVKQKDGSFDLTPLFLGSQGTLGVVSEVIMKVGFTRPEVIAVVSAHSRLAEAQEAVDVAMKQKASAVELIDGRILRLAAESGKKPEWAPKECFEGGVVIALFDDFSDRTRARLAKKYRKKLDDEAALQVEQLEMEAQEAASLHSVLSLVKEPYKPHAFVVEAFSGSWLPTAKIASFIDNIKTLEAKYAVALPVFVDYTSGYVSIMPTFDSKKVSERQKLLQLLAEVAQVVQSHDGTFAGFGGEGRLKAQFIRSTMADDEKQLYAKVKEIFDPMGILAPGVKAESSVKELAAGINEWCRSYNRA